MIYRNSRGQWYQSGSGGTYRVNNGDPQNDVDDFDEEEAASRDEDAYIDYMEDRTI